LTPSLALATLTLINYPQMSFFNSVINWIAGFLQDAFPSISASTARTLAWVSLIVIALAIVLVFPELLILIGVVLIILYATGSLK